MYTSILTKLFETVLEILFCELLHDIFFFPSHLQLNEIFLLNADVTLEKRSKLYGSDQVNKVNSLILGRCIWLQNWPE